MHRKTGKSIPFQVKKVPEDSHCATHTECHRWLDGLIVDL